jgi:ubiquinone/menaquinone biosynthesis C-methylase UbiE
VIKELVKHYSEVITLFGYMPNKTPWKDLVLKVLGCPSLIRRIQAPVVMKMLSPKESEMILDVGCGSGFFTYEIARKCKISIGIDCALNRELSFVANEQPNVVYLRGDVQALPLLSGKFDKILLSSVLQMVENDKAVLRECHRVLQRAGILVLSVPVGYCYLKKLNQSKPQLKKKFGAKGKAYYELNVVIELLQNEGFEVMEVEYSPKKLGSVIFEIGLSLWYHFGFPFFNPFLFLVCYPIAYFDNFADSKQIGNEVIIEAMKVSR